MSLGNYKSMLAEAKEKGYGIPSYNVYNYETMRLIVDAATQAGMPCILMLYPGLKHYIPMDDFVAMARAVGGKAPVPVGIHLDHSSDINEIYQAIALGFQSVMYDGSRLSFAENAAHTKELVRVAHAMGVDVEAELGLVGSGSNREEFKNSDLYTKPADAVQFVADTGVDALAVAIGNSHGVYIETPNLDISLLKEIRDKLSIPLVLHGTSHIPDGQLVEAVTTGIAKVNIATEFLNLFGREVYNQCRGENAPSIISLLENARKPMLEYLAGKFRLLNPKGLRIV